MGPVKQVILIRRDLGMRRGKEIAQGSHASMEFVTQQLRAGLSAGGGPTVPVTLDAPTLEWLRVGIAKVCLRVESEEELKRLHEEARGRGLKSYLIRDSGRTEFHGVPTYTACAIGPDLAESIDAVTGGLTLY